MRVIAGALGGRLFDSPHTNRTHPMSDKMRGALFNMLGDIHGLTVLDAFSGTGALSFEAVSRGASSAIAIEIDRQAQQTIARNIDALDVADTVTLVQASAGAWLHKRPHDLFDLVLCDPPYDHLKLNLNLLQRLARRIKQGGVLVLSWPGSEPPFDFPELVLVEQRNYGDAQLVFYRKTG
jgi:16S rRNA (guanine966-N2)-methyltransferase